jgi:thiosulfate/3-mercaptopyruvate sulfurtransferase
VLPPVVDQQWYRGRRDRLILADVRWYLDGRSGLAAYQRGHLPGAVFVDLDRWLAAPPSPTEGRHPLPDPQVFAAGMAGLGIGDDDVVVAYDDAGGVIAARLVWLLRVTGHQAALLDGGMAGYDGPLDSRLPDRRPAGFTARPWPADLLAGIDDVTGPGNVVIDARDAERYRGEVEPIDLSPGHIPGARNLPCRQNLDPSGRFLPVAELRRRFEQLGVSPDASVVSYCGSGVTACHNLLALELAGFGPGRLYPGSWSQYSNDASRPVARGDS